MIKEIHTLLHRSPFEPCSVLTSDGHDYLLTSLDHAAANPQRTRVVIFNDQDEPFSLSSLHIAGIRSSMALAS